MKYEMRRPKRRMTDIGEITKMIGECMVCRVGMVSEGKVYVVPMNFGYESRGDKLTFYLHKRQGGAQDRNA